LRPFTETSRSVRLLRALAYSPEQDGMSLIECLGALGEGGRHAKAATVTMLKKMRVDGKVDYTEPAPGARRQGGVYRIADRGRTWLASMGFDRPPVAVPVAPRIELVLETGAMRGERPTIVLSWARAGQCRPRAPNWVFGLADGSYRS
jgi:hypothetical protein